MATSEAVLQIFGGTMPHHFGTNVCHSSSGSGFPSISFCRKKRGSKYMKSFKCLRSLDHSIGIHQYPSKNGISHRCNTTQKLWFLKCKCQHAESASGLTAEGGNGTWFVDNAKGLDSINGNIPNLLELEAVKELNPERELYNSNGNSPSSGASSIEDEAWELLRESVVYYCSSPIGTIAANDPTSSSVLNYDQVFIRDFIPSGIAFLLKGEYDIVRNFILHTLQLQSWEKTMDCHSPGQGLMPASFKVRTVPLEGDETATEEVLDPDFGEAAIGRVAPVDSGLWWIILLRAYGKCSGDLSVQERIDVQTGIKMILKLCLADGFDMFPTLLVTDGSCMIDRRMGIHGHPLEIQA